MGGLGSGGARVGAGRPRKNREEAKLAGSRQRPSRRPSTRHASAPVERPADLPQGQAVVWDALAPHAIAAATLTQATAWAFRDLCEAIVLKRAVVSRIGRDGIMLTGGAGGAHPLLSRHVALMVRVEAGLARFGLIPVGKAVADEDEPTDEFEEFDFPAGRDPWG